MTRAGSPGAKRQVPTTRGHITLFASRIIARCPSPCGAGQSYRQHDAGHETPGGHSAMAMRFGARLSISGFEPSVAGWKTENQAKTALPERPSHTARQAGRIRVSSVRAAAWLDL